MFVSLPPSDELTWSIRKISDTQFIAEHKNLSKIIDVKNKTVSDHSKNIWKEEYKFQETINKSVFTLTKNNILKSKNGELGFLNSAVCYDMIKTEKNTLFLSMYTLHGRRILFEVDENMKVLNMLKLPFAFTVFPDRKIFIHETCEVVTLEDLKFMKFMIRTKSDIMKVTKLTENTFFIKESKNTHIFDTTTGRRTLLDNKIIDMLKFENCTVVLSPEGVNIK